MECWVGTWYGCWPGGVELVALTRADLDVTDRSGVRAVLAAHRPGTVVNCAAWTDVDAAGRYPAAAHAVNADGARHLAEACAASGTRLIQLSTDYVFAGHGTTLYPETAPPDPRTAYGRSKLAGERAVLEVLPERGYVVRTAWLYGVHGRSFVRTMIELERSRPKLDVVDDQRGQPIWTADLAELLARLGEAAARGTAAPGVYHGTAADSTTWYALARETFRLLGADPDRVRPTTSATLARPAPRPARRTASSATTDVWPPA